MSCIGKIRSVKGTTVWFTDLMTLLSAPEVFIKGCKKRIRGQEHLKD